MINSSQTSKNKKITHFKKLKLVLLKKNRKNQQKIKNKLIIKIKNKLNHLQIILLKQMINKTKITIKIKKSQKKKIFRLK